MGTCGGERADLHCNMGGKLRYTDAQGMDEVGDLVVEQ